MPPQSEHLAHGGMGRARAIGGFAIRRLAEFQRGRPGAVADGPRGGPAGADGTGGIDAASPGRGQPDLRPAHERGRGAAGAADAVSRGALGESRRPGGTVGARRIRGNRGRRAAAHVAGTPRGGRGGRPDHGRVRLAAKAPLVLVAASASERIWNWLFTRWRSRLLPKTSCGRSQNAFCGLNYIFTLEPERFS